MATKRTKKVKQTPLKLGPSISIDNVADLKKEYTDILKVSDKIKITSKTIENIDLSGIQFLLWLKKDKSLEKSISSMKFNETAMELINKSGFSKYFKK